MPSIPGSNRVDQAAVIVESSPRNRPIGGVFMMQPLQQLEQRLAHQTQDAVPRSLRQPGVELEVGREGRCAAREQRSGALEIGIKLFDQGVSSPLDRQADHRGLDEHTCLIELIDVELAQLERGLQRPQDGKESHFGNKHSAPVAVTHLHQPLNLEDAQGFAHAGPADIELLRQDLFRRQAIAWLSPAPEDIIPDLVDDGMKGTRP